MALAVITGASGFLGANLAALLLEAGHGVRATRRASTRIGHLNDLAMEWIDADCGDAAALQAAFRGADVVFHCAAKVGVRRGVTPEMEETNVGGTRNVIAAARSARVPRLVHVSSSVAVGVSSDGDPCTEESPWNMPEHRLDDGYAITKRRAEALVRESGLDAVVVNPCYMFGPRDVRPSSGRLIVDVVKRNVPGWTPGYNNFVDVRDVARSMIAAWQKGRRGERYLLGGHNLTYGAVFEQIAAVAGVRAPRRRIPRPAAAVLGFLGDVQERFLDRDPLVTSTSVRYAYAAGFRFSSDKARRELGHTVTPLEVPIGDAIAWFRAHGML
jgi:dihydroflavonol-4-reductase